LTIHIIGASGRSGAALCRALFSNGMSIVPVVRRADRWAAIGLAGEPRIADVTDASSLQAALAGAKKIVSCVHARHAGAILAAAPAEAAFVFLGSTRKFTRWPDAHGLGVIAGEAAFLASGRRGVMLHPTMIYGAQGEDNVQRLAALLKKLPLVPLPERGRARVQPIHQDDVTACIVAALAGEWQRAEALVIAGPEPVAYADLVRVVARAAGLRAPRIVNLPVGLLRAAAPMTRFLPLLPRIGQDEIRRLTEDKAFAIDAMRARLGVAPRSLEEGLGNIKW
jgi:nucleoside-diphosphate-sugar epimerase